MRPGIPKNVPENRVGPTENREGGSRTPLQVAVYLLDQPLVLDPEGLEHETGMISVLAPAHLSLPPDCFPPQHRERDLFCQPTGPSPLNHRNE